MKSICQVCNQSYRGIPLNTVKDGKQVDVCPSCYQILDAEYRKNSCMACVFFHVGTCELFGTDLEEPYVQNQHCDYFTTSTDPESVAKARIKKFELTGRFEDAAKEYEKLGMVNEAEVARRKIKDAPVRPLSIEELLEQLTQRGQALTYFCCHCGAPLKVGAKHEIQKVCPKCKYDLSALDMAKLISQHL